jgi:hypothetical protein
MWLRQFGPTVARSARLLTLPVTSILVVPGVGIQFGSDMRWWQMAVALAALVWVLGVQAVAGNLRLGPPTPVHTPPAAAARPSVRSSRLSGHTRMALQLAAALIVAFVVGRTLFPQHWNWTVLTAVIVCGGGPSRAEVVMKGASRLFGAGVGTVVAAALASVLPGHHADTVVLIFVLLFFGFWWRETYYAVWAACVTCVTALLNSYLGTVGTTSLLATRLEAILVGAVVATIASALILPITTSAIVRRRRGAALAALGHLAHGMADASPDLEHRLHAFEIRTDEARAAVHPLRLQHHLLQRVWPPDPQMLASVDALEACRLPARQAFRTLLGGDADPPLTSAARTLAHNVGRTRKLLAGTADEGVALKPIEDDRLQPLHGALVNLAGLTCPARPTQGEAVASDRRTAE